MTQISPQVKSIKRIDGIYCTVTGAVYNPGQNTYKKSMTPQQYKDFQIFVADRMCEEFIAAIDKQKARTNKKWQPLSIKYYTWKKRHNLSLNIWEATGHMKSSLKVFKKGNFIAVGFKQSDLYPKSGLKVNQIARYLEFGGRKIPRPPSRPLFRPTMQYMRKNISWYYKQYEKALIKSGKQYLYER